MNNNENQGMKKIVEQLVTNLGKQGIRVTDAAVLKLDGGPDKKTEQAVNSVLADMAGQGFPGAGPALQQLQKRDLRLPPGNLATETATGINEEGPCFCPNCFRFDNFEEILRPFGGQFDYVTVSLLGKQFEIKYHKNPQGKESMLISEKIFSVDPSWTADQIKAQLNIALANKDFAVAQTLLNALNNLKNQ